MAYSLAGIVRRGLRETLKASAAETTSTTHSTVHTKSYGTVGITVAVTAASGTTPTLVVVVEGSHDASTWFELGRVGSDGYRTGSVGTAPANFSTTGTVRGAFVAPQYVRSRSVVGGTTPSFTYSVLADVS